MNTTTARSEALQSISQDVLADKFSRGTEKTIADVNLRVARALAAVEAPDQQKLWEEKFFDTLQAGFLPTDRIQAVAGTEMAATLINCFVQPVGDFNASVEDGHPGIDTALTEAAETIRCGGGVGYDFSRFHPHGAWGGSTQSSASGPVSYMRVFDRSCETVEAAGARRGAQMGVLRCDHPDIEEFIHAKDKGDLKSFNISVGVTDEFMKAVQEDADFALVHRAEPGQGQKETGTYQNKDTAIWVYRKLKARALWDQIMRSTYNHGEPGVLFLDQINRDNNLSYCETIASTNPSAEQPLPPYGCCCLGSIDLTRFVLEPFSDTARFDETAFVEVSKVAVRMLDNVLEATAWPLPQQQQEACSKRRVGLGFTGLGDALVMLGLRYDTSAAREKARKITELMRDTAYSASADLAGERGAFPLFNADLYLSGQTFASRLPTELKERIRKQGLRNSHLLSIAHTGTISLAFADNVSDGIEPAFSWTYTRRKRMVDGSYKDYDVEDHAYRLYRQLEGADAALTAAFVTALEMSVQAHAEMVAAVAPYIDTAISKTVNVPTDYRYEDFQDLYTQAWKSGLKGLATYRPNSLLGSVLSVTPTPSAAKPLKIDGANHRFPAPVLSSLRKPGWPELPGGNPAWTFMVHHPFGDFSLFSGEHNAQVGGTSQMNSIPTKTQLPPTLAGHVSAGQASTVEALINPARHRGGAGAYFAQSGRGDEVLQEDDVFELSSKRLQAASAVDMPNECIGSVKLDITAISPAHDQWISLALIVRYEGNWYAVDLEVVEDEVQDDVMWLSSDPASVGPWSMEALRSAFASAKWVYRLAGLGVFVAGSVDLDSARADV